MEIESNSKYSNIRNEINKALVFDDKNEIIVDLYLSTALSVHLDRPIWLMIIAPPSSGKTELLNIISKVKGYHALHTVTPRHLFSGHPSANGGYMIREVGKKGILAFPDFTTVLCLNSKARNEIFNQLRVIYDGEAGLGTGVDVGSIKTWKGRVAVLATVTQTIDKLKERSNDLGERFLYFYYFPKPNVILNNPVADLSEIKSRIPIQVKEFLTEIKPLLKETTITQEMNDNIFNLAQFICLGRSVVERCGYSRAIENIHRPEQPYRIVGALTSLQKCLICINGNNDKRISYIISKVAMSSIPISRLKILLYVYQKQPDRPPTIDDIISQFNISSTKIKRDTEDLVAQKMLRIEKQHNKFIYFIHSEFLPYLTHVVAPL